MDSNHNKRSFFRLIPSLTTFAFVLFLASGLAAFAQVDQGSITGLVTDTTGAVVPNAKVTLLNTDQGLTLETNTTSSGEYTFSPVRIGHYTVSVSTAGFATTTQQNLTVNVSQNLRVDVQLKPGSATQTVEVTAAPPVLQTEDASLGQVVTGQSVNNLPLNGRNFTFLAQLSAGVNTPQADTRGNAASGAFTANGLRPAQNNYLLDGIDNNSDNVDFLNGTNFVVLPPPDALSEFKVQTSDYSAELGRAAGAVLNATIKSGTNQIHGTVWEFFRNDVLDAADWFENNAGIKKGELRWNQFGGSIGGPIIKNKIFYFGDYQG
ncbi:MAG: carboxypeptidase regulatory-like domain-containing protein, partial [Silvibacterium sp.]|nr:carboxypeptidase regulatory-like domain-containing protein [Silvibacterium sp.]